MNPQNKKDILAAYKQRAQVGGVYAVTNTKTGKALVLSSADLRGIQKRYEFAEMTGGCFHPKLMKDTQTYGSDAFAFSVLEELTRKDTQTDREFANDLELLLSLWLEKYDPAARY
ncbi:hypothetical protein SDC9_176907 [bioreactor metagenome]|uniref:GIY-YIG domain-containing protein n=1 Tax=bioreactor metagenome TaxID=1076179 RepID=A0A645GZH3_9ZZZZ|nr:GIY-YIG nuclease family protein [Christensenella sp.]